MSRLFEENRIVLDVLHAIGGNLLNEMESIHVGIFWGATPSLTIEIGVRQLADSVKECAEGIVTDLEVLRPNDSCSVILIEGVREVWSRPDRPAYESYRSIILKRLSKETYE